MRDTNPCRHVYTILDRPPQVEDCNPKALKLYELYYLESKDFREMMDKKIAAYQHGLLIRNFQVCEKRRHSNHDEWFQETNGTVCDRNPLSKVIAEDKGDLEEAGFLKIFGRVGKRGAGPQNDLDVLPKHKKAHQSFLPTYSMLMDLVKTEGDYEFTRNAFSSLHSGLLARQTTQGAKAAAKAGGLASLAELDRRHVAKRKKPMGSPEK